MQNFYANKTARFDGTARALTEDELRKLAPSVFAETAHESRSDRFAPIPTIQVVRALACEGFVVVGAKQSVARCDDRRDYTKHLLRLRRLDAGAAYSVGGTVCEMLLKNANDGSAAYDLMSGLFRIECFNSLVTPVSSLASVKVRHSGDVAHKVIDGTFTVLKEAQKALAAPAEWSGLHLCTDERRALANAAHVLRFGNEDGETSTPIQPEQLLRTRRTVDNGADLWTTFNVVQENVIRGGLRAIGRDGNGRRRRVTTRAVNGIDQDVKLNRALFTLAAEMAKIKGAPLQVAA